MIVGSLFQATIRVLCLQYARPGCFPLRKRLSDPHYFVVCLRTVVFSIIPAKEILMMLFAGKSQGMARADYSPPLFVIDLGI